jgi:hypothetical protein
MDSTQHIDRYNEAREAINRAVRVKILQTTDELAWPATGAERMYDSMPAFRPIDVVGTDDYLSRSRCTGASVSFSAPCSPQALSRAAQKSNCTVKRTNLGCVMPVTRLQSFASTY